MAVVHVCPQCKKEYTNKKELRACLFTHLAEDEDVVSIVKEDDLVAELIEVEEDKEELDIGDPEKLEYYVTQPVIVQAGKDKDGNWVVYNGMGERSVIKPEHFQDMYTKCDGEVAPVVIPNNLCPAEIEFLSVNQVLMLKLEGLLTEDRDVIVRKVDFVRR